MEELVLATPPKTLVWPSELRARRARAWVNQLPIANSIEAAGQVYRALFHLNRSALEPEDRLELLALYGAPVASITEILSQHLAAFSLPLSGSKRKLADFLRELPTEMAYGYKAVVKTCLERRRRRRSDLLAEATQQAIRYLGEVLAASYRAYLPCPSTVWKEIHSLYLYAEQHGLLHQGGLGERPVNIRERYVQVLLLGAAGPYQFALNECARVEALIAQCAARAMLRLPEDTSGKQFQFVVKLKEDAPPGWAPPASLDTHMRVLDVSRVVTFLGRAMEHLRRGKSAHAAGVRLEVDTSVLHLIERLVGLWATPASRRHRRVKSSAAQPVAVAHGFKAAHYFISGQAGVEVPPDRRLRLVRRDLDEFIGLEIPEPDAVQKPDTESCRVLSWVICDEAAEGLALARDGTDAVQIQSGEMVAVERTRGAWQLGLVRWLRTPDPERVEMGLQLLEGGPRAVILQTLAGPVPALILETDAGERLFVPPSRLRASGTVSVRGWPDTQYRVAAVARTPAFEEWRLASSDVGQAAQA